MDINQDVQILPNRTTHVFKFSNFAEFPSPTSKEAVAELELDVTSKAQFQVFFQVTVTVPFSSPQVSQEGTQGFKLCLR